MFQDARIALRSLAKQPGFAIVLALTVAVGIGAATAIFGVVHSRSREPLPAYRAARVDPLSCIRYE